MNNVDDRFDESLVFSESKITCVSRLLFFSLVFFRLPEVFESKSPLSLRKRNTLSQAKRLRTIFWIHVTRKSTRAFLRIRIRKTLFSARTCENSCLQSSTKQQQMEQSSQCLPLYSHTCLNDNCSSSIFSAPNNASFGDEDEDANAFLNFYCRSINQEYYYHWH